MKIIMTALILISSQFAYSQTYDISDLSLMMSNTRENLSRLGVRSVLFQIESSDQAPEVERVETIFTECLNALASQDLYVDDSRVSAVIVMNEPAQNNQAAQQGYAQGKGIILAVILASGQGKAMELIHSADDIETSVYGCQDTLVSRHLVEKRRQIGFH